jgi:hypothetical protein
VRRPSSWTAYGDDGRLIGDVHGAGRQFDAAMLSGQLVGTYATQGSAVSAIRRRARVVSDDHHHTQPEGG